MNPFVCSNSFEYEKDFILVKSVIHLLTWEGSFRHSVIKVLHLQSYVKLKISHKWINSV